MDPQLKKHDTDQNGEISLTEKEAMNAKFIEKFDEDGDKILSPEERNKIRNKQVKVRITGKSKAPVTLGQSADFLKKMDTNKDGLVSEEEAGENRWKVMSRADANQDGEVSAEEWLNRNTRDRPGQ